MPITYVLNVHCTGTCTTTDFADDYQVPELTDEFVRLNRKYLYMDNEARQRQECYGREMVNQEQDTAFKLEISELQTNATLTEENTKIKQEIKKLREENTNLKDITFQGENATLREEKTDAQQKNEALENENNINKDHFNEAQQAYLESVLKKTELEMENIDLRNDITKYLQKITTLQQENDELKNENEAHKEQNIILQQEKIQLRCKFAKYEGTGKDDDRPVLRSMKRCMELFFIQWRREVDWRVFPPPEKIKKKYRASESTKVFSIQCNIQF